MNQPTQKALIQFLESLIITALIAALIAVGPALTATGTIDWKQAGIVAMISFIFSVAHGLATYLKAYNFFPLGVALETDLNLLEKKVESGQQNTTVESTTVVMTTPAQNANNNTTHPLQGVGPREVK